MKLSSLRTLACFAWLAASAAALAQDVAAQNVRFVVSIPPGGSPDIIARKLSVLMRPSWGYAPITENKVGATGTIAADAVAKAPPGSTPLLVSVASTFTIVPHVFKKLPYDPDKDIVPVVQIGTNPFVLLVNAKDPARNLQELLDRAKAKPDSVSFGSFGNGSVTHVIGEALNTAAGIKMLHVPYRGTTPSMNDLLGGQLTVVISDLGTARPFLDGRLRALAITGSQRNADVPDVPTFGEQGLPALNPFISWIGIFASANTPTASVKTLADDLSRVIRSDFMRSELRAAGFEATGLTTDAFGAVVKSDNGRWGKVIQNLGSIAVN